MKLTFINPERIMDIISNSIAYEQSQSARCKQAQAPLLALRHENRSEALEELLEFIKLDEKAQSTAYIDDFNAFQAERDNTN